MGSEAGNAQWTAALTQILRCIQNEKARLFGHLGQKPPETTRHAPRYSLSLSLSRQANIPAGEREPRTGPSSDSYFRGAALRIVQRRLRAAPGKLFRRFSDSPSLEGRSDDRVLLHRGPLFIRRFRTLNQCGTNLFYSHYANRERPFYISRSDFKANLARNARLSVAALDTPIALLIKTRQLIIVNVKKKIKIKLHRSFN